MKNTKKNNLYTHVKTVINKKVEIPTSREDTYLQDSKKPLSFLPLGQKLNIYQVINWLILIIENIYKAGMVPK